MSDLTRWKAPSDVGVVLFGFGAANQAIARVLRARNIPIVAVVTRGSKRLGHNIGVLLGDNPWGPTIRNDLPDLRNLPHRLVAFVATGGSLAQQESILFQCVTEGISVITLAEEALDPWNSDPRVATRINEAARKSRVSVLASGHTDTLWVQLPVLLASVCGDLTSVQGVATRPLMIRHPEDVTDLGLGRPAIDAREVKVEVGEVAAAYYSLRAVAMSLGLAVTAVGASRTSLTSQKTCRISDHNGQELCIEAGTVAGIRRTVEVTTAEGVLLSFTDDALAEGTSTEEWQVSGEPGVTASLAIDGQGMTSTATQAVNRLSTVLQAPDGFLSPWELGVSAPHIAKSLHLRETLNS